MSYVDIFLGNHNKTTQPQSTQIKETWKTFHIDPPGFILHKVTERIVRLPWWDSCHHAQKRAGTIWRSILCCRSGKCSRVRSLEKPWYIAKNSKIPENSFHKLPFDGFKIWSLALSGRLKIWHFLSNICNSCGFWSGNCVASKYKPVFFYIINSWSPSNTQTLRARLSKQTSHLEKK